MKQKLGLSMHFFSLDTFVNKIYTDALAPVLSYINACLGPHILFLQNPSQYFPTMKPVSSF